MYEYIHIRFMGDKDYTVYQIDNDEVYEGILEIHDIKKGIDRFFSLTNIKDWYKSFH